MQDPTPSKSHVNTCSTSIPTPKYGPNNPRPLPSQSKLIRLFKYEDTGELTWIGHKYRAWNSKQAGAIDKRDGYHIIRIAGINYKRGRIIYKMHHGVDPDQVDHHNRIRDDDRIENLRDASPFKNSNNRASNSSTTSGVLGVTWDKQDQIWKIRCTLDGETHTLGRHKDILEAVRIRLTYHAITSVKYDADIASPEVVTLIKSTLEN